MSRQDKNSVNKSLDDVGSEKGKELKHHSPHPSHMSTGQYAVLMETSEKECESWYYFIRMNGNESALRKLANQLEQVEWYIQDDLSTFDLDLEHTVTAKTAKQMTKLELNSYSFHRKFDGKLQDIHLGFKKRDTDERKMEKAFDLLGYGQIEDYIEDEDIDPEDLTDASEDESDSQSETDSESDSESDSDSDDKNKNKNKTSGIPPALLKSERPRWTRSKGCRKHR